MRMAQEKTAWAPREASFLEATRTAHQQAAKAWSVTGCSGQFAVFKKHQLGTIWWFSGLAKTSGTIGSQVSPDSDASSPHAADGSVRYARSLSQGNPTAFERVELPQDFYQSLWAYEGNIESTMTRRLAADGGGGLLLCERRTQFLRQILAKFGRLLG